MPIRAEAFLCCSHCSNKMFLGDLTTPDTKRIVGSGEARELAQRNGWLCFNSKVSATGKSLDLCLHCRGAWEKAQPRT